MKKRFIAALLALAALMCAAGCGEEEKDKCAECGKTADETFLFQHDDGNLYCAGCRKVPAKAG